ncbi:hypothetical protein CSA08_01845 [Candidatus Gracilibacteria bacterium]|nr:MAG: hypothetical protein CSA08_01845 [Candidatus Gracilibacteria bacterium]
MKILLKLILSLFLFFGFITGFVYGGFSDFFTDESVDNPYKDKGYNLSGGLKEVKDTVDLIETDRRFSEYIQDVVKYLLGFVTVIAIIYMIYGGFTMMISAGDEEKVKKTKNIIIYVIIGIFVIWIANSIVLWLFEVFEKS